MIVIEAFRRVDGPKREDFEVFPGESLTASFSLIDHDETGSRVPAEVDQAQMLVGEGNISAAVPYEHNGEVRVDVIVPVSQLATLPVSYTLIAGYNDVLRAYCTGIISRAILT